MQEATLRDVARKAAVSPATVSRVFSGHAPVREQTRSAVMQAADELGYVFTGLADARTAAKRRPLVFIEVGLDPATAEIISGVQQVCADNNRPLNLCQTNGDPTLEATIIKQARDQRSLGVILATSPTPGEETTVQLAKYAATLAEARIPLVLCNHPDTPGVHDDEDVPEEQDVAGEQTDADQPRPDLPTVTIDYADAARQLVEHLVGTGRRRFALLGPVDTGVGAQFQLGVTTALKQAGLELDPALVAPCACDITRAQLAALLLLAHTPKPDALICLCDDIALGAYYAARDLDITIPDDLAIAGFGDTPYAAALTPSLTSVGAPFHELGVKAAELALGLSDERHVVMPTQVALRDSTAPVE